MGGERGQLAKRGVCEGRMGRQGTRGQVKGREGGGEKGWGGVGAGGGVGVRRGKEVED